MTHTEFTDRMPAFLATYAPAPFRWSAANCAHFASDWVRHATGRDPIAVAWPTGRLRDALRLVRRVGLAGAISMALGQQPIAREAAAPGDVVMLAPDTAHGGRLGTAGVLVGEWVAVRSSVGVSLLPAELVVAAWRVGQ